MSDDPNTNAADGGEEVEEEEVADVLAMLDLTTKKKKKTKKKSTGKDDDAAGEGAAHGDESAGGGGSGSGSGGGDVSLLQQQQRLLLKELDEAQELGLGDDDRKAKWSYDDLLDRVVEQLIQNHPDLVEKKRTRIKPPQLQLMSSKKTLWVNFQEICSMMARDPTHVYQFFMAELGTEGSIDGNQRLIIRGKYVAKYIESLLRKYVIEYVTCEMCRSPHTELTKDPASRLYFCNCLDCGSRRSVAPIRSGYHATSRADRRAARNAKG
jgi:translation initiation factor 2 subunit 2